MQKGVAPAQDEKLMLTHPDQWSSEASNFIEVTSWATLKEIQDVRNLLLAPNIVLTDSSTDFWRMFRQQSWYLLWNMLAGRLLKATTYLLDLPLAQLWWSFRSLSLVVFALWHRILNKSQTVFPTGEDLLPWLSRWNWMTVVVYHQTMGWSTERSSPCCTHLDDLFAKVTELTNIIGDITPIHAISH